MIEIFSTCPPSSNIARSRYLECVADVARWSERAGCTGILVYSDNSLVDPWMLSHVIVQNTSTLCPLVAIQPVYMHPYWVAKQITSFGYLYGRRLFLNMVAGGFKNDLEALNDQTPHDLRYARLIEYTAIVTRLLENGGPLTFDGAFYKTVNLKLAPPLSKTLLPGVFVSGSSEAGLDAAKAMGATAIKYPKPAGEEERPSNGVGRLGIRVGIIARERSDHAWTIARSRFPEDRRGQLTHELAMKTSDSVWHTQLSDMSAEADEASPYWLVPFQNYKTMCPYLVGSYDRVAHELGRYIALGYQTFILDVPSDPEELEHINMAFTRAQLAIAV
jgi:alkanesulfonate monooxygenase